MNVQFLKSLMKALRGLKIKDILICKDTSVIQDYESHITGYEGTLSLIKN